MKNTNIHVLSRAVIIDEDHILVCKTTDLEHNFYFLPGGHVEHGESVKDTVIRELFEEAGAKIEIKRFLGCLEYSFIPGYSSMCHNHEYNFFFEATSHELSATEQVSKLEDHIDLMWIPYNQINKIDFRPSPLKDLLPKWLDTNAPKDIFHSKMV